LGGYGLAALAIAVALPGASALASPVTSILGQRQFQGKHSTHVSLTVKGLVAPACMFDTPSETMTLPYSSDNQRSFDDDRHFVLTQFRYNCTNQSSVSLTVGPGSGGGPTGSSAWKMYDAKGHALAYVLYKNKQGWFDKQHGGSDCEDGVSPVLINTPFAEEPGAGGGSKNELTLSICGSIASDQRDVKSGTYNDYVTLTLVAT
jgi:spore coat protein U-like protein